MGRAAAYTAYTRSQSLDGQCFRDTRDAGWSTGDSWWCDRNKHWAVTHKQQSWFVWQIKTLFTASAPLTQCWIIPVSFVVMSALKGQPPHGCTLAHSFSRYSVEETWQRIGRPMYLGSILCRVKRLVFSPYLVWQLVIQWIACKTTIRI